MKIRFTKTVSMKNPSDPQPTSQRQLGPVDVEITDIAGIEAGEDRDVVVVITRDGNRIHADLSDMTSIPIVQG